MIRYLSTRWGACIAIAVLALLAYGRVIENDYVWDDRYFLVDYTWIETIPDAIKASLEPLFGQRSYVRPLPLFTLYVEAIWSGRNPAVSHAINLLIHIVSSLLVYLIARRAEDEASGGQRPWVPFLVAALFTVHPALSENVVWISSRFDLLATLFALAAIWLAGSRMSDWSRAAGVAAMFLLAALCKESVAVLPAVLGVLALMQAASRMQRDGIHLADAFTRREWKLYGLMVGAGVLYLAIRYKVLAGANLLQGDPSTLERHVVWMGVSLFEYAKLTMVPFVGNSPHHTFVWSDAMGVADYWPKVVAGFGLLAVAAALAALRKHMGWWLLGWLVCYVPVLHLIQLTIGGNIVHQRFMYLPTAVLLAFAPYVLASLRLSSIARRAAVGLSWALIAVSVMVCNTIVPAWKSDLTLWRWTVAMDPGSVEARENLLWAYLEADMFEQANEQMTFIRQHGMKTSGNVAVNMGAAHYQRGEFDQAQSYYDIAEKVMDAMPKDQRARLLSNIAINHAVQGKVELAGKYLIDSLSLDPKNTMALGQLLAYCGSERLRLDAYSTDELARAGVREGSVRAVLTEAKPEIVRSGKFCPSDDVLRSAGF